MIMMQVKRLRNWDQRKSNHQKQYALSSGDHEPLYQMSNQCVLLFLFCSGPDPPISIQRTKKAWS